MTLSRRTLAGQENERVQLTSAWKQENERVHLTIELDQENGFRGLVILLHRPSP